MMENMHMRLTEDEYRTLVAEIAAKAPGPLYPNKPDPGNGLTEQAKDKTREEKSGDSGDCKPRPRRKRGPYRNKDERPRYKIVVIAKKLRPVDPDGIFPKWEIDQLVKAGILEDDSSKFVASIEKKVEIVGSPELEETIIEVWEQGYLESSSLDPNDDI